MSKKNDNKKENKKNKEIPTTSDINEKFKSVNETGDIKVLSENDIYRLDIKIVELCSKAPINCPIDDIVRFVVGQSGTFTPEEISYLEKATYTYIELSLDKLEVQITNLIESQPDKKTRKNIKSAIKELLKEY